MTFLFFCCLKLDFLSVARSLACEGRIGWASELSIHVYEGRCALVRGGRGSESEREEKEVDGAKVREME